MQQDFRKDISPFSGIPLPEMDRKELKLFLIENLDILNSCESFSISILNARFNTVVFDNRDQHNSMADFERLINHLEYGVEYIFSSTTILRNYHLRQSTSFKFFLTEK